jgi:DNA-binding FadR family transcriptional regulator
MKLTALEKPKSRVEAVCEQLGKLIRKADPGDREACWLPGERSLAERLGVSRSVVREAIQRLVQQGLLEIQHGNGVKMVQHLHRPLCESLARLLPEERERLRQLNELRLSLEPDAAALAAERRSAADLKNLQAIHARLLAATEAEAAIHLDLAFHQAIAAASGNRIFQLVLDSLAELGLRSRLRSMSRVGTLPAVRQHAAILRAIESADAAAARRAMRAHVLAAVKDLGF